MNPFARLSSGASWLSSRSTHWKVTVAVAVTVVLVVVAANWAKGTVIEMAAAGKAETYVVGDQTPGGTPVAEAPAAPAGPACRNPFGSEAMPFELTADAQRMIGADPTGSMVDPCVAADLAWKLLLAVPMESTNGAGRVCAARLFTVPRDDGAPGGQLQVTFDPTVGTVLLDCSARSSGAVQVPDGGRLPTVTTTAR